MPPFTFGKKKLNPKTLHFRKSGKIAASLKRLSVSRRNAQLREEKAKLALKPKTRITVKGRLNLNKSGTLVGMHNAGKSEHMKQVRAMRRIFNRAMPVLQCANCSFATSCPQFKAGYECAYLPYLNSHVINSEGDLMEAMKNLCEASMSRVHRQAMMETLTGGMPSLETSEAMNIAFMQLKTLHDKMTETDSEVTIESEDETIIGRLFGGLDNLVEHTTKAQNTPIELAPKISEVKELAAPSAADVNFELIKEHTRDELVHLTGNQNRERKSKQVQQQTVQITTLKV